MAAKMAPGTVMPCETITGGMFSLFRPMIAAADGLALGQVCAITGLEYSTVQNWVKRGFVAHPVRKKYYERQFARILVISALRDCMKIEQIVELLALINGSVIDESDDIIAESKLYDYLCEIVRRIDERGVSQEEMARVIDEVTDGYTGPTPDARRRLKLALLVMVCTFVAGRLKQESDLYFGQLREGETHT